MSVDPNTFECGAATPVIRALVAKYNAIDWYVPPADSHADAIRSVWRRHVRAVDGFYGTRSRWSVELESGDWARFVARSTQVRSVQRFDWRNTGLKRMSMEHNAAHELVSREIVGLWREAGPVTVYQELGPRFSPAPSLSDVERDAAVWYAGYAQHDARLAIEWLICEPHASIHCNPFVPLIDGYEMGVYPFVLERDRVVLFTFR